MKFEYNDGGRKAAGYKGSVGDCAVRAIAIAIEQPYQFVYDELSMANLFHSANSRDRVAKKLQRRGYTPRNGMFKKVVRAYMDSLGWAWVPTMRIGSGCTVHLREDELPSGRLVVSVSHHYTAVIDGVIHDTYDPSSRGSTIYSPNWPNIPKGARQLDNGDWIYAPDRCVYGYWTQEKTK